MSARLRVKMRTSSPERCTWMRAPSSLYSTDALPTAPTASAAVGAVLASIGRMARPTTRPVFASSSSVPVSAVRAVLPRSPESIAARRTVSSGRPEALATASVTTPSSAPVRTSPRRAPRRNACSPSVARPIRSRSAVARASLDPDPDAAASWSRMLSTCPIVRVGSSAGDSAAADIPRQPTPSRPCRGFPRSSPMAGAISSGSIRRRSSASASTFASRDRVAETASEVTARSLSSIRPVCHRRPTRGRCQPSAAGASRKVTTTSETRFVRASPKKCVVPGNTAS